MSYITQKISFIQKSFPSLPLSSSQALTTCLIAHPPHSLLHCQTLQASLFQDTCANTNLSSACRDPFYSHISAMWIYSRDVTAGSFFQQLLKVQKLQSTIHFNIAQDILEQIDYRNCCSLYRGKLQFHLVDNAFVFPVLSQKIPQNRCDANVCMLYTILL